MKKFIKIFFTLLFCLILALIVIRFGPSLYHRFFGNGNTLWISERFSEELKEKNQLVVFETVLKGQETVKQEAWLIGTVQEVIVPYSYSIHFVVDLSGCEIAVNNNTIEIHMPFPKADYSKLTVDEEQMKKRDWLYPLTPKHYASIKTELEAKLYSETANKKEYLDAAWQNAVKNIESLFQTIAESSEMGPTCEIKVIQKVENIMPVVEATVTPEANL